MSTLYYESSFVHHGVKGQKWGVRRYQNYDGTLIKRGKNTHAIVGNAISKANERINKKYPNGGRPENYTNADWYTSNDIDRVVTIRKSLLTNDKYNDATRAKLNVITERHLDDLNAVNHAQYAMDVRMSAKEFLSKNKNSRMEETNKSLASQGYGPFSKAEQTDWYRKNLKATMDQLFETDAYVSKNGSPKQVVEAYRSKSKKYNDLYDSMVPPSVSKRPSEWKNVYADGKYDPDKTR